MTNHHVASRSKPNSLEAECYAGSVRGLRPRRTRATFLDLRRACSAASKRSRFTETTRQPDRFDHLCLLPSRPQADERNPERAIERREPRPVMASSVDLELLAQCELDEC
jgi:hypothetical protein